MCGRYTLIHTEKIAERYNLEQFVDFEARYNVSPGSIMPVITKDTKNRMELMKWGLIPHWAKDPRIGYKMINARAENIDTTTSYKVPIKSKRCLIPADGFFEWKKGEDQKTPYYFKFTNNDIFSFAGIYDNWVDAEGKEIKSFSIITTEPNDTVKSIHDRMPVILTYEKEPEWLNVNNSLPEVLRLLKSYKEKDLEVYEVSSEVNNPRNQSESIIARVN
jgi:putative SOS response-associated peptidase YedK